MASDTESFGMYELRNGDEQPWEKPRQYQVALYLMGVKVSKPLATVHGSLLALISSCRLRAVMSTAKAKNYGAQCAI